MPETLDRPQILTGKKVVDRDNRQGTPTEPEIAWLAGIIEAEGSVMLSCYLRDENYVGKPRLAVNIKLYNTDGGIIRKAVDILERLGLRYYLKEREQKPMMMESGKRYGAAAPMLSILVSKMDDSYRLAKLLRPWTFGEKGARLDLIIQFLARRIEKIAANGGNYRNAYLDKGDISIVCEFYRRFVTRPGNNKVLVEGLLNEHEQPSCVVVG